MSEYSPENRKLLAAAFTAALDYLAKDSVDMGNRHKSPNICGCLDMAYHAHKVTNRIVEMAIGIVMNRLGIYCYYLSWVRERVGVQAVNYDQLHNSSKKIQAGRRRWLKSLIKEFSS